MELDSDHAEEQFTQKQTLGRERLLRELTLGLLAPQTVSYALVGANHVGKTKLLHQLASDQGPLLSPSFAEWRPARFTDGSSLTPILIDCHWPQARRNLPALLIDSVQQQRPHSLSGSDSVSLDGSPPVERTLWQLAQALDQNQLRLILLLDNFDRLLADRASAFDSFDKLSTLSAVCSMVVAAEQPLHDVNADLMAEPLLNTMVQRFVGLIDINAATTWIEGYLKPLPDSAQLSEHLFAICGRHPFLLDALENVLSEVLEILPSGHGDIVAIGQLLGLRLAEHGRPLFMTQHQKLRQPPETIPAQRVDLLLARLAREPIDIASLHRDDQPVLNWLINQAVVTCEGSGCRLYSPLFADYLRTHQPSVPSQQIGARPWPDRLPDLPIYHQLTKTEEALLRYFQLHSHQTITPEQLLTDVWQRPDASSRRVQEAIRRLRLQLVDVDPPVGIISNERGRGYRFIPA